MRFSTCLFILFLLTHQLSAQINDSIFLFEGDNFQAQVFSNGQLFGKGNEPLFKLNGSDSSMAQSAGLWIAGVHPAQYFQGAIHYDQFENSTDFQSGSIEGFGIDYAWKITKDEIMTHLNDYFDNGTIDDPIASIYAWPARENPYFEEYNGFALPENSGGWADFFDRNGNEIYEPHLGEYPDLPLRGCVEQIPDQMLWLIFNDQGPHELSNLEPIPIEVYMTLFSYDCSLDQALSNTLFVDYKLINKAVESIDSTFVGLYLNPSIGSPVDDYLGTIPDENLVYAYDANQNDDPLPVLSTALIQGPLDQFGESVPLKKVMPIFLENDMNDNPLPPQEENDFYKRLTGSWNDGSPLTNGGNGFGNNGALVDFAFPDYPWEEDGWSEQTAGNILGNRAVLSSYGPFRMDSGVVNNLLFSIGIYDDENAANVNDQIQFMESKASLFTPYLFECDVPDVFDLVECETTTTSNTEIEEPPIFLYPNPNEGILYWRSERFYPIRFQLFSIVGEFIASNQVTNQQLNLSYLKEGVYLILLEAANGDSIIERIVIQ